MKTNRPFALLLSSLAALALPFTAVAAEKNIGVAATPSDMADTLLKML